MTEEARIACVQAIMAYCQEWRGQMPASLVICCRSHEYQELTLHLRFNQAVSILLLTDQQVNTYLSCIGKDADGLRYLLATEPEFASLAHNPLMLNIATLAFQGKRVVNLPSPGNFPSPDNFPASASREQLYQIVFCDYVKQMLERRGKSRSWTKEQFLHWLVFVAKQLHHRQQTVFMVEDLQPDWLPEKVSSQKSEADPLLNSGQEHSAENSLGTFPQIIEKIRKKPRNQYRLSLTLFFWAFFGLICSQFPGVPSGLLDGVVFGLIFGLIFGLSSNNIRPAETFIWSRRSLWLGPAFGLVGGLFCGLIAGLFYGLLQWLHYGLRTGLVDGLDNLFIILFLGLLIGLLVGLGRGFSGRQLQLKEHEMLPPNEGIRRSGKRGLLVGLVVWLAIVLLYWLVFGLYSLLTGSFAELVGNLSGFLFMGLITGLIFGLVRGLSAVIQHYTLRFWLWRTNCLPWKLILFLDEAAERLLLRKVGGSYIFVHRLLLDYFVTLDENTQTVCQDRAVLLRAMGQDEEAKQLADGNEG